MPAKQSVAWSATQYVVFEDERGRPVRDLLVGMPDIEPRIAVDIGCGPGKYTERLGARFPRRWVAPLPT